jgi:mRNA interferase MazF
LNRNEIWWAQLPEPAGRRPVLLLSRREAYAVRRRVVVAEVTTRSRSLATEVRVGRAEGLDRPSVVNLENLATIPKDWLLRRAGALGRGKVTQVNEALRFALEIP